MEVVPQRVLTRAAQKPAYLFALSRQCKDVDLPGADTMTESDLVRDARRGDEQAFLALYHRHRSPVFKFAWRLTGSQAEAEDIAQECFLAMVRGAAFDANRGTLRTYLFGIARNLVFRQLRIAGREAEESADAVAPIDVMGDLLAAERSELVAGAVARLPLLQREALVLFTFEQLPLDEIARITAVDAGAVKSRLHRARESLRAALAPFLVRDPKRRCL
jgi:RNA polymerase sigma-70 factor (ECF subfamily)